MATEQFVWRWDLPCLNGWRISWLFRILILAAIAIGESVEWLSVVTRGLNLEFSYGILVFDFCEVRYGMIRRKRK